jgi:peptidoglycan/LPS O-acetylase OafA/YrhL
MAQTLLTPEAPLAGVHAARVHPPVRKPPLPALTGVRTLLAVNIMFFHFTPPHMKLLYPMINNSYVFVGFFFLLSGYVLAYNYADREVPLNKRQFWKARFARLYPLYAFSLVFSVLMVMEEWHARSHGEFFAGLILTPLLLQGWDPWLATFWNTVAWTLSVDLFLYLLFPYLLRLPWPKKPMRLVGLVFAMWAVGLIHHLSPHEPRPSDCAVRSVQLRVLAPRPQVFAAVLSLHLPGRDRAGQAAGADEAYQSPTDVGGSGEPCGDRVVLRVRGESNSLPPYAWGILSPAVRCTGHRAQRA